MKKEIKGTAMYVYRGDTYFERPKGTRAVKTRYDETEQVTFVTVKKNYYLFEVVAAIILLATVLLVFISKPNLENSIYYSTPVEWYEGKLNINLTSDRENKLPVEYNINGTKGILLPGDVVSSIPCEVQPQAVNISLTTRMFIFTKVYSTTISVYNLSEEGVTQ